MSRTTLKAKSILELIQRHAKQFPDKLCIADRKQAITYGGLLHKICAVARYLTDQGVEKGNVVGLRSAQSVQFAACFFGIQWIGAVVCPLEKSASPKRTKEVLSKISGQYVLDFDEYEVENAKVLSILNAYDSDDRFVDMALQEEEGISEIIFTTGTTGQSKGILVSNRCNLAIAENVIDSVSMTEDEVELISSPTSHSLAIRRLYAAMYIGSSVIFSENFLLYENLWGLIDKYNVTAITIVPAILNLILEAYKEKLGEYDARLNYIQIGSAPLHEYIKERLLKLLPTTRLYNTYGATESGCTIVLEFSRYGDRAGCVGKISVNTRLFFTDKSRTHILESTDEKTAGYLAFDGDMNMSGYVGDPDMTAEVLADGVIYTNDIGYLGADGLIYLLGRDGEVINSGGLKINPVEIEEIVEKIDKIRDCACVPAKNERLGEVPKLYIACESDFAMTNQEIKKYIRKYLEDYKVPVQIERISQIPRTFNGKIIRKQLIEYNN